MQSRDKILNKNSPSNLLYQGRLKAIFFPQSFESKTPFPSNQHYTEEGLKTKGGSEFLK